MIYVLEGPNCIGKSTVAALLARRLGVPVYGDAGRHGFVEAWLGPLEARDWGVLGAQRCADAATLSLDFDAVVDRWIISDLVHNGRRDLVLPDDLLRRLVEGSRAAVALLDVGEDALLERAASRGLEVSRAEFRGLRGRFAAAADRFRAAGGDVLLVPADGRPGEVLDRLLRRFGK